MVVLDCWLIYRFLRCVGVRERAGDTGLSASTKIILPLTASGGVLVHVC